MKTENILGFLQAFPEFKSILKGIDKGIGQQLVYGVSGSQKRFLLGGLIHATQRTTMIITHSIQEAKKLVAELKNYLPKEDIYLFPANELLSHDVVAQSNEFYIQRLEVMTALAMDKNITIIATGDSLLRKLIPIDVYKKAIINIKVGQSIDISNLLNSFVNLGYKRVDLIEGKGQFSVRGGIVDIFPLAGEPLRFEFFDDEVDSIRIFDIETQKSIEKIFETIITPAKEVLFNDDINLIRENIFNDLNNQLKKLKRAKKLETYDRLREKVEGFLEEIDNGINDHLEGWLAYLYPEARTLLDYLPPKSMILIDEPKRSFDQIKLIEREHTEIYLNLLESGRILPGQMRGFINQEDLILSLANYPGAAFSLLPKQPNKFSPKAIINLQSKSIPAFNGKVDLLLEEIKEWRRQDYSVVLVISNQERCQNTRKALLENGIEAVIYDSFENTIVPGQVAIIEGLLENGFDVPQIKLIILTDWELFGKKKSLKIPSKSSRQSNLAIFSDLKIGDFVVHINHGIGKYLGVEKLEIGGVHKDYLVLKYAGEDKLYITTDQVGSIQKYLGAEAQPPKLYKLGGNDWIKVKSRVKASIQDMAQDLLALYAVREKLSGFSFSPDTIWQKEFDDAFPYEETPDQLKSIEEIKRDMEKTKPMDRLLCGDVGYGKTEVAIRAAFKAIMDGKQVAVLVPTTILAQQHFNTFKERFADYPIKIEMLSRFRSPKEQKISIQNAAIGMVDVIIGTHRIIQGDVKFKDLGLLIIDEEQRFGVAHKEKLKQLKKNIDVLTLTATPIPRTLHMSLVGVRDMSVLETPPEDRFPVQTFVVEFNYEVIRDVIRREINRGGQVYFVHNKIMDLEKILSNLETLIPEARIAVAHGRMKEDKLEAIMLAFMEGEYDVLLCTTIIETGLDIPNVNTLIVDEADKMGLSQLYQLRGRVGRSSRQAYAYFTYRRDKVLTEVAEKRLYAIREFTEFGSGFKIAMRDLEIRGAGNILGPEQHGDMVSVGFDMYCRLLEEAIQEIKGEKLQETVEPSIDINIDAFIGDDYINETSIKFDFYKKIMHCHNEDDIIEVEEELIDRFGDLPVAVHNLMGISKIKVLAKDLGVMLIKESKDVFKINFLDSFKPSGEGLIQLGKKYKQGQITFAANPNLEIKLSSKGSSQELKLKLIINLLNNIKSIAL